MSADSPPPGPDRQPAIRVTAMPADANPGGDIFGGWLRGQMALAAGLVAMRVARGRTVTVAVEAMTFLSPVSIGDEVSVYADLVARGRTSMRIAVEALRRERPGGERHKVTEAVFTFVASGQDRRPVPLPPAD